MRPGAFVLTANMPETDCHYATIGAWWDANQYLRWTRSPHPSAVFGRKGACSVRLRRC